MFYGAAEFSRDTDLAILASSENLAKLKKLERFVAEANPFFWFLALRTPDLVIELAEAQVRIATHLRSYPSTSGTQARFLQRSRWNVRWIGNTGRHSRRSLKACPRNYRRQSAEGCVSNLAVSDNGQAFT